MKLSHTQKELYNVSPMAWFIKYVLKYKEKVMTSPLFFGSLVEEGVNALLEGSDLESALIHFEELFISYDVNGKDECLKTSKNVKYSKADYQELLFTEEELILHKEMDHTEKAYYSLLRKGKMMITEFHDNILPNIKRTIAMQEPINIKNEYGDEIIGFADMIVEWKDGRILVLDLKTSASPYKKDAVLTEEKGSQTALYYEALKDKYKLDGAGFLVLEKKVRVRDPQMRSQILIDVPPEELIQETFDNFDKVFYDIRQAKFPCTAPVCNRFGKKCSNAGFCSSGGVDVTGLVRKEVK